MSKPPLMKNISINPEDYTILAVDDIAVCFLKKRPSDD